MSQTTNNNLQWWEWISLPTLTAGLIYLIGWAYAYVYFSQFGVGLLTIDIPHQYFVIYGFWVLRDHWWLVLPLYIVLVGGSWWLQRQTRLAHAVLVALLPALILLVFMSAYAIAAHSAERDFHAQRESDYSAYPRIRVWLKADVASEIKHPALNVDELPGGCYRLLLHSKGKLLLFYTSTDSLGAADRPAILHVPESAVQLWRVLPQYGSCA